MYKRPHPMETDEDLLKLQEEFLRRKAENEIVPAAKLISDSNSKSLLIH